MSKQHLNRGPKELFKKICMIGDCEASVRTPKESLESYLCGEGIITSEPGLFDPKDRFVLLKKIADLYKKSDKPDQSADYCRRALEVFQQHETDISRFDAAAVHCILGHVLSSLDQYDEAIGHLESAIELYRKDKSPKSSLEVSRCYFSIGQAYLKVVSAHQSNRTEQAIDNFDNSLRVRKENNEPMNTELGVIYTQKGLALMTVKRYKEAKENYQTALSYFGGNRKKEIMER